MAGCCATYLFFSYASATIIYLILGLFASTGNVVLLIENYQYENSNDLKKGEQEKVRKRTSLQFYFAFLLSLFTSLILYVFFIRERKDESKNEERESFNKKNKPYQPIILDAPEGNIINTNNDLIPRNDSNNNIIQSINTISDKNPFGMKENEI